MTKASPHVFPFRQRLFVLTTQGQYITQNSIGHLVPVGRHLVRQFSRLMFYKQNSFAGRVSPSEASVAYQPQVGTSLNSCQHFRIFAFCIGHTSVFFPEKLASFNLAFLQPVSPCVTSFSLRLSDYLAGYRYSNVN